MRGIPAAPQLLLLILLYHISLVSGRSDPPAPAPGTSRQSPPGTAQFFQHQGSLLPPQAPQAEAPAPSSEVLSIGLEEIAPAAAQSPLGAIAATIVDQVPCPFLS